MNYHVFVVPYVVYYITYWNNQVYLMLVLLLISNCLFYNHITFFNVILQWVTALSMARRWIQSQDDAGGLMARSGGAPKMRTRTPSTVSATCTVAVIVQESMWNHKPWRSLRPLWHHWLLQEAAVGLEASRAFPCMPWQIPRELVLELANPNIIWTLFPTESQAKITGIDFVATSSVLFHPLLLYFGQQIE